MEEGREEEEEGEGGTEWSEAPEYGFREEIHRRCGRKDGVPVLDLIGGLAYA